MLAMTMKGPCLYGLGYPRLPSPRVTLRELFFFTKTFERTGQGNYGGRDKFFSYSLLLAHPGQLTACRVSLISDISGFKAQIYVTKVK